MAKKYMNLTEEDLVYVIKRTVQMLQEDVKVSDDFWQTNDTSDSYAEKPQVKTEDMPNTDSEGSSDTTVSDSDSGTISDWGNTGKPEVSREKDDSGYEPKDSTYVKKSSEDDSVENDNEKDDDSKESDGNQVGQGGDPFSQKVGDDDATDDNGGSTESRNNGWGDSVDNIIDDVLKDYIKK